MDLGEYAASQANIFQLISGVPIDATQTRQLYFTTETERDAYFSSKVIPNGSGLNFKYVRQHRAIKVQTNEDNILHANYCRFRNTTGFWWYAFITDIEYVNPKTALVRFRIDTFQTFFLKAEIRECDITREHTENQTLWQNTVAEEVDYGDYRICNTSLISYDVAGYLIVSSVELQASGVDDNGNPYLVAANGGVFNAAPSACTYYVVADTGNIHTSSLQEVLRGIAQFPWVAQCIIGVYAIPEYILTRLQGDYVNLQSGASIFYVTSTGSAGPYQRVFTEANWLEKFPNYTAKKLLTYPYSFIEVISPDGGREVIKPELIGENEIDLEFIGRVIFNPVISWDTRLLGYAGTNPNDTKFQTLTCSGAASYPVQNNQYFASKMSQENMNNLVRAQNAENLRIGQQYASTNLWYQEVHHGIDLAGQAVQAADPTSWMSTGGITGNLTGMAHTGLNMAQDYEVYKQQIETANRMEQQAAARDRLKIDSNQNAVALSGATNAGNSPIDIAAKTYNMIIRYWTVKPEFRPKLESYFSAFGYRSNRIGVPNFSIGQRYHYIRCASVNIYGDIPNQYLNELQNMFLDGITLWKDHENVGTYGNN